MFSVEVRQNGSILFVVVDFRAVEVNFTTAFFCHRSLIEIQRAAV